MSIKNQNIFFYLMPVFYLCMMGLLSCFVTHANRPPEQDGDKASLTPQIVFLNYSVKLVRPGGEVEIQLINKIITDGKLKINSARPEIPKPDDLICISLNDRLEPVDSIIISDPLNITVESVDENNSLFKKEIARDSAQFSIRLQLTKEIQSIAIKKNSNSDDQNPYLLITKIKEL
jgi:hypothetical protein